MPRGVPAPANNLTINIGDCEFTNVLNVANAEPNIYGLMRWDPLWRDVLVPPMAESYTPSFGFSFTVPLRMTSDLDRQLRTGKLLLVFADDKRDHLYGYVKVPLKNLATGKTIDGLYGVEDAGGVGCGTVRVSMDWQDAYVVHSDTTPKLVSLMDDEEISREINMDPTNATVDINKSTAPSAAFVVAASGVKESINTESIIDDDICSLSDSDAESNLEVATVHDRNGAPVESGDCFTIAIDKLQISIANPQVAQVFRNTQNLFVGFEFGDIPAEELESQTIEFQQSGEMPIKFKRGNQSFKTEFSRQEIQKLKTAIRDDEDLLVIFNIVQEPSPEQDKMGECVDLGLAKLNLKSIASLRSQEEIALEIYSLDKRVVLGKLSIRISGIVAFK